MKTNWGASLFSKIYDAKERTPKKYDKFDIDSSTCK